MQDHTSALFWARVDVQGPDDCWLWGFYVDRAGYGRLRGPDGRPWPAHRVAYTLTQGAIPGGKVVLHQCDVRSCCNPAHLKLGTQPENIAEMIARGRYKAVGDSHRRVLTPERKAELKQAWYDALFWSKVDKRGPDECWEWQARRDSFGYGQFGFAGKHFRSHRYSYELANGPIPKGLVVMHACDNPPCCNPAHLSVGTKADNTRDMDRKGRRKPGGVKGPRHHNYRLTEEQVAAIRAEYQPGVVRLKDLAERYGASMGHVCQIVNRQVRV